MQACKESKLVKIVPPGRCPGSGKSGFAGDSLLSVFFRFPTIHKQRTGRRGDDTWGRELLAPLPFWDAVKSVFLRRFSYGPRANYVSGAVCPRLPDASARRNVTRSRALKRNPVENRGFQITGLDKVPTPSIVISTKSFLRRVNSLSGTIPVPVINKAP